ncbi:FkbM family methyltransferase [Limisphaera sp. 4302-co]|uniref:FkbM family methyltransferase n=1 Tax=Limisphaera sp. 4302-co TaxID=3400417 RepID=UPI003C135892
MILAGKKNPVRLLGQALRCWWSLRDTGAFSPGDAWMNWRHWLWPGRWMMRHAARELPAWARAEELEEGVHRVRVEPLGVTVYWPGQWNANVYHALAQECDPAHPHHYTTPPIELDGRSVVVDVGACEGLFACRVLKQGLAARVIAFEPSARTAACLRRAAEENGLAGRLTVEVKAVTARPGPVPWVEGEAPEANRIGAVSGDVAASMVEGVSLDAYCEERGVRLGPWDLIKIDAEGADLDVLRGAERLLQEGAPQVAVTTYHVESHAREIWAYLRRVQPAYRFRIKGLWLFGPVRFWGGARLRPVLLQAAVPVEQRARWEANEPRPSGRGVGGGSGVAEQVQLG